MQDSACQGPAFFASRERLENSNFVIINQKLASEFFPNEDPLGKHLAVSWRSPSSRKLRGHRHRREYASSTQRANPQHDVVPHSLWNISRRNCRYSSGCAVATDPAALGIPIQKIIAGIDPDLPVSYVLRCNKSSANPPPTPVLKQVCLAAFATLSLLLAAVGLFGVLSYLVRSAHRRDSVYTDRSRRTARAGAAADAG